eukprot:gnl/Spiro4/28782_TR14245_c0_g1_i1.p1 gnl/Spiro4/28782_TR14245_c0_g1~~gnl/Spiro4/28782_TR14245_c0_g1_i1.p1  ORF type:complete len:760 (+),score=95.91 gnl/Spiro4/28782_TR14245_c0_g1_i1:63-2342(+)
MLHVARRRACTHNRKRFGALSSAQIKKKFLNFFEQQHGHRPIKSSSLIPNDPTLLFTNSGMVQFKDMFMGRSTVYPTRVVSVQKCVRAGGKHNDLSNVGFTNRHLTFFEMLGNFSFGDYGAREAIRFAWMFLTSELGLPSDRLAVSVLRDDHDTAELWRAHGLASDRIFRCDPQDNFWSMGDGPGPCGPCTEIFWDQGELVDGDRWLEIWNIVLMNLNRGNDGSLAPLARPCIDTGMGLERIASILQGRRSNFDIDTLAPLVQDAGRLIDLKAEHGRGREWVGGRTAGLRVVADHLRSAAFLIADGVTPSNVGRGYVLRRIIRRAVLFSTLSEPFLGELYGTLEHTMGTDYPELAARRDHVVQVLGSEEEAFNRTLDKGLHELRNFFQRNEVSSGQHRNLQQRSPPPPTQSSPQPLPSQSPSPDTGQPLRTAPKTLPSAFVHRLYDTFGFPVDLTLLLCSNRGWTVDHQEVDRLMEEQRTRARASWIASGHSREFLSTISSWEAAGFRTEYCGDATTSVSQCTVRALARSRRDDATLVVAIDPCPLYPEGGGQVGDLGTLCIGQHTFPVVDTQRPFEGGIAVQLRVPESLDLEHAAQLLQPGTECSVHVDVSRRRRTSAHHSATHLLQHALREVLGPHVCQAGSSVAPSGLRFDFSHSPLSTAQVKQVEDRVNELCLSDFPVVCSVLPLSEALGTGALSFFRGEVRGRRPRCADGAVARAVRRDSRGVDSRCVALPHRRRGVGGCGNSPNRCRRRNCGC